MYIQGDIIIYEHTIPVLALKRDGIRKEQFNNDFIYTYPPTREWPKADPAAFQAWVREHSIEPGEVSAYFHIPFCSALCHYCHYYKRVGQTEQEMDQYVKGLLQEIDRYATLWRGGHQSFNSVFFGGGTPTYLSAEQLQRILHHFWDSFSIPDQKRGMETTVESSPENVDAPKLVALREAGFNRINVGVQTFDDVLIQLTCNRKHTAGMAEQRVQEAQQAGFPEINVDLIYGLPSQSISSWEKTVEKALSLETSSVTASNLRVMAQTKFFQMNQKVFPKDREVIKMHRYFIERMYEAGYVQIFPYQFIQRNSRFEFLEQQWSNKDYLGMGASGLSHLNGLLFHNDFPMHTYLKALHEQPLPISYGKQMNTEERMIREVVLALKKCGVNRKDNGVSLKGFAQRFGIAFHDIFGEVVQKYAATGLFEERNQHFGLSPLGLLYSDEIGKLFYPPIKKE